jgi:hypothetical protein
MRRDPSEPVTPAPLTLMNQRPRHRGIAIVVGVGLLVGAGIALAVALGSGDEAKAKTTNQQLATPIGSAAVKDVTPPPPPVPVPDKPIVVEKAPEITAPPTADTKAETGKPPHVVGVSAVKKSTTPIKKPAINAGETHETHETHEMTVKPATGSATPPVTAPQAKCDPFGSMHGCDNGAAK